MVWVWVRSLVMSPKVLTKIEGQGCPYVCECVWGREIWVFPANIYIVRIWLIVWILTFISEPGRTGSEITFKGLRHKSVRQEEFSQLSEHTGKKRKNKINNPLPPKTNKQKIYKCLFAGSAHEESCVISRSYCITLYIAPLVISKWSFGGLKIRISAQKLINNETIQLMVTLA